MEVEMEWDFSLISNVWREKEYLAAFVDIFRASKVVHMALPLYYADKKRQGGATWGIPFWSTLMAHLCS